MSGAAERPWWASDPDSPGDPEDDPLAAHRRARAGTDGGGDRARDWWTELAAAVAALGGEAAAHRDGEVCGACPVCTLLRVVERSRPDVLAHLGEAARHLSLAVRAVVDAHAASAPDDPLHRIDLDEE